MCGTFSESLILDSIDELVCSSINTIQFFSLLLCSTAAGMVIPPEVLLLFRIVLAILDFLLFYMKLRIAFSKFIKECFVILMGIALNL